MAFNEDNELSLRIHKAGGQVWYDPAICTDYFASPSLRRFWRQYFQYGEYKIRVAQKRNGFASVRHVVPATFVAIAEIVERDAERVRRPGRIEGLRIERHLNLKQRLAQRTGKRQCTGSRMHPVPAPLDTVRNTVPLVRLSLSKGPTTLVQVEAAPPPGAASSVAAAPFRSLPNRPPPSRGGRRCPARARRT